MIALVCTHCGCDFSRDRLRKFCSHACRAAYGSSTTGEDMPRPRIPPRGRCDREVIGAAFLRWDGSPLLLAELAALLEEPDLYLRVGILRPWVEAIITPAGPLLYARTCGSDEVHEKKQAVCNLQTGSSDTRCTLPQLALDDSYQEEAA